MANQSVPNQYFTRRKGVKVYHLHRDDCRDDVVLEYWYSVREHGKFDDRGSFDVRELEAKLAAVSPKPLRDDMSHREIIKAAIDAELIAAD